MDFVEEIAQRFNSLAEQNSAREDEYLKDGLVWCRKCNTPRQKVFDVMGKSIKCRVMCQCAKDEEARHERETKLKDIERYRSNCFRNSTMFAWTFETDDCLNQKLSEACKKYCENFKQFKSSGKGLLLYGDCGTGKSYISACICNKLVDSGYQCYFTSFSKIVMDLQALTFEEKKNYYESLNRYSLIVFDDLGTERNSDYMREQVFNIIDTRYRSGLPFIITTNLTAGELKNNADIGLKRIYDRIIERCYPIKVEGTNRRTLKAKNEYQDMNKILGI